MSVSFPSQSLNADSLYEVKFSPQKKDKNKSSLCCNSNFTFTEIVKYFIKFGLPTILFQYKIEFTFNIYGTRLKGSLNIYQIKFFEEKLFNFSEPLKLCFHILICLT